MATTKATTLAHTIASTTSSTADLDYAKTLNDTGVTSTEFDKLDGLTATTDELNLVDGSVSGPLSHRNIVINGAMNVAQRGSQVTGVTSGAYRTVDRMKLDFVSLGTWTIDQSTDAPTGFSNSLKATCTTADASPAASDKAYFLYGIEAQDLQHLSYGTTSAQSMTLSFYVKSNKTGTSQVNLLQVDNSNKQYSVPYTISSADTWEHKQVTISGDTSGLINNDTGKGLQLEWFFNSGSDSTGGTAGATWQIFDATDRNASNLGVGGAISDYFAITGVQLELGSVATPFEHRSYMEELQRCRRYYYVIKCDSFTFPLSRFSLNSGGGYLGIPLPVEMNHDPDLSTTGTWNSSSGYAGTPSLSRSDPSAITISSGVNVAANGTLFLEVSSGTGSLILDSEI